MLNLSGVARVAGVAGVTGNVSMSRSYFLLSGTITSKSFFSFFSGLDSA